MNDSNLQFAQPAWIFLGLGLVALGFWMFRTADRRRRADLDKLAHPRFQQRLIAGWSPALRWIRRGLWLGASLLLCIAAARPQLGYEWREVKRRGIDILFAVDTSRSMLAEDLTPNRLERARLGILDFLARLEGDRVGLVPFAGSAFALCPLTLDYGAFRESLNSINTDLIPRQGTDLASAIREADRLFDAEGNHQRFLVLITDGEDLQGEAAAAAEQAKKNGTTIHTVGVGATEGQLIPVRDRYGRESYLTDDSGAKVTTRLDEAALRKIADLTGGLYVPLGRGAEGLDAIYRKRLSLAPKSELAQKLEKVPLERFQWPLGAALLMLALQAVLGERKPEGKRRTVVSIARRVRPVALLAIAFIASASGSRADTSAYNKGTSAYNKGEYEQAVEQLRNSLETPDISLQQKAYYNLGNSLFRIGEQSLQEEAKKTMETWRQAIKAYDDALALEAEDADARFNRDFVQRKLDQLEQQQQKQDPQDQEDSQEEQNNDQQQDGSQGEESENPQSEGGEKQGEGGEKQAEDQPSGGDEKQPGESADEGESESAAEAGQDEEEREAKSGEDESPGETSGAKGQEEKSPEPSSDPADGAGEAGNPGQQGEAAGAAGNSGEQRVAGEMSKEEAMRLLDSLGDDERIVIPVPSDGQNRDNTTNGKTW